MDTQLTSVLLLPDKAGASSRPTDRRAGSRSCWKSLRQEKDGPPICFHISQFSVTKSSQVQLPSSYWGQAFTLTPQEGQPPLLPPPSLSSQAP